MGNLALAVSNFLSVPVLVFLLAVLAARLKTEVKLPDSIYQGITIFLLIGIGLKGGHALKTTGGNEFLLPAVAALALGIIIPLLAYLIISRFKKISIDDRGSIAAHYGSTSLVTFSAGLVMLESMRVFVEPYVATLLAIMEIPGIIVGIFLGLRLQRGSSEKVAIGETLREVFLGRTVLLLIGGLVAGFATTEDSFGKVKPMFVDLQPGILVLFLLHLGFVVGSRLSSLREAGIALPVFGILMPVIGGSLGVVAGHFAGMSAGGATMLAVLTASASYIAAPAAVSLALPKANLSVALSASLGVTFPFNLIVGIPLYLSMANLLSGV
ncbi:MAG: sodium-dependent bicarbonate transport family permease [Micrococcales bacterium]